MIHKTRAVYFDWTELGILSALQQAKGAISVGKGALGHRNFLENLTCFILSRFFSLFFFFFNEIIFV